MKSRYGWGLGAVLAAAVVLCHDSSLGQPPERDRPWVSLTRGDTLDGWYTFLAGQGKNKDPDRVFTMHQGIIHVFKDTPDGATMPFGYIATEKEYSDYQLRLEFKWGVKKFAPRANAPRDAGVLYHFAGLDRVWPQTVECQIMETNTGDIFTVGTTVTSTINPLGQRSEAQFMERAEGGVAHTQGNRGITRIRASRDCEREGWNTVEIIVRGDSAVHIINGTVNNRCDDIRQPDPDDPQRLLPLKKGKILLQAEGAEIFYRNIAIRPLL